MYTCVDGSHGKRSYECKDLMRFCFKEGAKIFFSPKISQKIFLEEKEEQEEQEEEQEEEVCLDYIW
jgi:hypothetical protein